MGSTSLSKPPVLVASQFSAWVPLVVGQVESQLVPISLTTQDDAQTNTQVLSAGERTAADFPRVSTVSPPNECRVHCSEVLLGGHLYQAGSERNVSVERDQPIDQIPVTVTQGKDAMKFPSHPLCSTEKFPSMPRNSSLLVKTPIEDRKRSSEPSPPHT